MHTAACAEELHQIQRKQNISLNMCTATSALLHLCFKPFSD